MSFVDPIININYQKKMKELQLYRDALRASQDELTAVQFTPYSLTGFSFLSPSLFLCKLKNTKKNYKNYFLSNIMLSCSGKKLVSRCKMLLEENEQLGRILSSGNVHRFFLPFLSFF